MLRLFRRAFENLRGRAARSRSRIGNLEELESRCVLSGMGGGPHFHEDFHAPPPDFGGSMFAGPFAMHGGPPRGGPGGDFHPPSGFLPPPGPSMAEEEFAPRTRDISAPRTGGSEASSALTSAPLLTSSLFLSPTTTELSGAAAAEATLTSLLFGDSQFLETALATSTRDAADSWATTRALDRPLRRTVDGDEPDAGEDADQRKVGDLAGQSVDERESTKLDPFASRKRDKNKAAVKGTSALLAPTESDGSLPDETPREDRLKMDWRSPNDDAAAESRNRQTPQPEDGLVELSVAETAEFAAIRAPAQPEIIFPAPAEIRPDTAVEPALELYQAIEVNLSAAPVVQAATE